MLCGVGERFGHDVVGGDLNWRGQPYLRVHLQLDVDNLPSGHGLQRSRQAAPGEDGGMDAGRDLLQLIERALESIS
jgi:hypothetical protein